MEEKKALTPLQEFNRTLMNPATQEYIKGVLAEKKQTFMNNIVALVSLNRDLQRCKPMTVVYAALKATALGLPFEPSLGQAWVIPYNSKDGAVAQFQMGARGYVQLALRTGKFQRINTIAVKEGELVNYDILTGDLEIKAVPNRESKPTIGYAAYFKAGDYEKALYLSKSEMEAHAKRYSKSYSSGPWSTNFDEMAEKTVLARLLKKWAPMAADNSQLQEAIRYDQSVIEEPDGEPIYVDGYTAEEQNVNAVNDRKAGMKKTGVTPDNLL
jgi:recombination protein RecT